MNNLRSLFLATVEKTPENIFLSNAQQQSTYRKTFDEACFRAQILLERDAHPRDRVIIVDNDSLETVLWMVACMLINVVFVILPGDTSIIRMNYFLQDIEPIGIIGDKTSLLEEYDKKSSSYFVLCTRDLTYAAPLPLPVNSIDILETDPAFLTYTSGSTGMPKAVICSHRSALSAIVSINSYLPNSANDRIGHLLSLSYVYGLYQIFIAIHAQASIIFLGKFRSPLDVLEKLSDEKITAFPALPPIISSLTKVDNKHQLLCMKYISSAGDYLNPSIVVKFIDKFPSIQFFYMYGLSECARALYMPPERIASKPESVGQPIPGTRAFIVNDAGKLLPTGETGELIIEGPHVMNGYWRASAETAEKFLQGLYGQPQLRTGDLFFQDHDGDFHFVGRKSSMIKSRGIRISPKEIELAILAADPLVRECIVYGVEDEVFGQAIQAKVIVDDPSHTIRDIFARCRATIEPYLIPMKIEIVDTLPRTSAGKYSRCL